MFDVLLTAIFMAEFEKTKSYSINRFFLIFYFFGFILLFWIYFVNFIIYIHLLWVFRRGRYKYRYLCLICVHEYTSERGIAKLKIQELHIFSVLSFIFFLGGIIICFMLTVFCKFYFFQSSFQLLIKKNSKIDNKKIEAILKLKKKNFL